MDVPEMKELALEKLAALQKKADVLAVLDLLQQLHDAGTNNGFDADVFFKEAIEQYGDVLKKLAQ